MDGAGGEPSVRRIGGRATQEQLPSASDVTISNYLNYGRKIAALRSMTPVFRLIRVSLGLSPIPIPQPENRAYRSVPAYHST
jgi:hypothetical protein